jgi:hypothetical protein
MPVRWPLTAAHPRHSGSLLPSGGQVLLPGANKQASQGPINCNNADDLQHNRVGRRHGQLQLFFSEEHESYRMHCSTSHRVVTWRQLTGLHGTVIALCSHGAGRPRTCFLASFLICNICHIM